MSEKRAPAADGRARPVFARKAADWSGGLTPFVRGSIAWHGAMAAGLVIQPALWSVWVGGVAANQLILTSAGLWPRSRLLGPNLRRLPARAIERGQVALTLDDGPDPAVTPQVLDILATSGARATFFCPGHTLRQYPALARQIVAGGHSIENHSDSHPHHFAALGPAGLRREITAAQTSIHDLTGEMPRFFRAPAGLRNPLLQPILAQHDLQLTSWTRRGFDTVWRDPARVSARLERGLAAGDILLLHDGNGSRDRAARPIVLTVLPRLLDRMAASGLRSVTLREAIP